jgi:diguanylate cyclase (GGDEF)-like protein/PAS domain S-box-containing protein
VIEAYNNTMSQVRICIAEDVEAVTREITTSLEKLGYLVLGRADRSEAILPMVQEILPDLVFIEISIQREINGVEVGRQIQTDFDIPVIFISAHVDANTPEDAMPAQAYGFMVPPFEVHALDSTIAMALDKHQRIRKFRESEERYALAVRAANDGIWDWNLRTSEIYFSVRWKEMLGYRDDEIGAEVSEWLKRIHPDDQSQVRAALDTHLRDSTPHFECEYRIQHANGTYLWVLSRGTAMRDSNGSAYRLAGSQSNITARKLAEERLAHDAVHDALTGLPNRILFLDRLQNRLERTKRNPDEIFAVMFIDLDRFKVVNDSLGHAFGDQLLITTGWRLQQCLRPQDTVARLSGDEFAVLLDVVNNNHDIPGVAERIRAQLITTTLLGVVERSPTASIGVVMFNKNYTAAEDLLRDADLAMYHAKRLGGNQYQFFDETMHTIAVEQLQLEGELRHAVARKEWLVYYQPIISITSGEPVGAEALVRWMHPQRGILAPGEFIQVAEDTGLIVPIGEYVLRTACQQAKAWRDAGYSTFWVSVNISARQFRNKDLIEMIARILEETGLPSGGLRLEITESVAVQNTEYTIKIMNELDAMGVYTSLDDFGTGYSSLSYLKQFPLRVLKVDQSFIQDIQHSPKNEALIKAIIGMARSLGLEVVGEGVEKAEQLQFLRTQMCDQVQGFLFSRPIPAEELGKLLE